MKDFIKKYYKVVIAQCMAFGMSWVLVNYVFLGPLPTVRAEFKENVRNAPSKAAESVRNAPELIAEIASSVLQRQEDIDPRDDEIEIIRGQIGDVWDFKPLPTDQQRQQPIPTNIINPTIALPTPYTSIPLPTGLPLPTARPQPTQAPRPTSRPTAAPTPIPTYKPANLNKLEKDTIAEINKERQAKGLPIVKANSALTDAARAHSTWMGSSGSGCSKLGHIGEGGSDPGKRARDAGYRGGGIGETVACGYGTAPGVVDGWMGSTGHRAILLNASMKEVGVGWSNNYTTAVFGR